MLSLKMRILLSITQLSTPSQIDSADCGEFKELRSVRGDVLADSFGNVIVDTEAGL